MQLTWIFEWNVRWQEDEHKGNEEVMKSKVEFKKFAEFWTLIPKEIDIVFHEKRRDENAVHDIHDG